MRFISFLAVTQNAALCLKRLNAFLFRRLASLDTLFHYRSGKASFAQVRSSKRN